MIKRNAVCLRNYLQVISMLQLSDEECWALCICWIFRLLRDLYCKGLRHNLCNVLLKLRMLMGSMYIWPLKSCWIINDSQELAGMHSGTISFGLGPRSRQWCGTDQVRFFITDALDSIQVIGNLPMTSLVLQQARIAVCEGWYNTHYWTDVNFGDVIGHETVIPKTFLVEGACEVLIGQRLCTNMFRISLAAASQSCSRKFCCLPTSKSKTRLISPIL